MPRSSIHMTRAEAKMIIHHNLTVYCRLYRPNMNGNWSDTAFSYLDQLNEEVGYDIGYFILNDDLFPKFMRMYGALYWYREYCWYEYFGMDVMPTIGDQVLALSCILKPSGKPGEYGLFYDEGYGHDIHMDIIQENELVVDELNQSHHVEDLMVDGYIWAQNLERQVCKRYRKDHDSALGYLLDQSLKTFGLTKAQVRIMH